MTETAVESESAEQSSSAVNDEQLIAMLVDRARSEGLQLTGEGGLLQQLTKRVLESGLEGGAGVVPGVQVERATVRTTWTPGAASARLCLGRWQAGWEPSAHATVRPALANGALSVSEPERPAGGTF